MKKLKELPVLFLFVPGMTEFAEAAGLDINGSYSIADLKKATQNVSRDIKVKYYRELKITKLI